MRVGQDSRFAGTCSMTRAVRTAVVLHTRYTEVGVDTKNRPTVKRVVSGSSSSSRTSTCNSSSSRITTSNNQQGQRGITTRGSSSSSSSGGGCGSLVAGLPAVGGPGARKLGYGGNVGKLRACLLLTGIDYSYDTWGYFEHIRKGYHDMTVNISWTRTVKVS